MEKGLRIDIENSQMNGITFNEFIKSNLYYLENYTRLELHKEWIEQYERLAKRFNKWQ